MSQVAPPSLAEPPSSNPPLAVPRRRPWRLALLAPVVLGVPWLFCLRDLGVPAPLGTLQGLLLVLTLGAAVATDLLYHRIFNWTTYSAVVWVFVLQLVVAVAPADEFSPPSLRGHLGKTALAPVRLAELVGLPSPLESLQGLLLGFAIMLVLYVVFRGGAGDLKLIAALGALLGVDAIVPVIAYTYIIAGVFAACYIVTQVGGRGLLAWLFGLFRLRWRLLGDPPALGPLLKRKIPMAVYIALGAVAALLWPP